MPTGPFHRAVRRVEKGKHLKTHRRPGARRLEQTQWGTLHLPRRPLTVFDDARATAVAATRAEAPELVAEVGRLRSLAFADEAEATEECYGSTSTMITTATSS